ncbi:dynein axonemal assembly factor 19 [Polymixia lowei]
METLSTDRTTRKTTFNKVMERSEDSVINFSALERELRAAVEEDRRYRRENDAKLRAVNQRVASYEEFRDIVLSCHLRPLEKRDKDGASRKQPWNPLVSASNNSPLVSSSDHNALVSLATTTPLASSSNHTPLVSPSNNSPLVSASNHNPPGFP